MAAPPRTSPARDGMSARLRWSGRLVLILAAVAAGLWLARLDYGTRISTNIVDLIPADERQPELQLVRSLMNDTQARVLRLVLEAPAAEPEPDAVAAFVAHLRSDAAFAEVQRIDRNEEGQKALAAFVFQHRFLYLLPEYLARSQANFTPAADASWPASLADQVVADLDAFLQRPDSGAFDELIPRDPLLLVPRLAEAGAALTPAVNPDQPAALIFARLAPSPFEEAGQEPVFAVIAEALAQAQARQPELTLQWSGLNRLAAASKARIRGEITWLNAASLAAVLLVTAVFARHPWRVIHLLPVIVFSLLGAWVAVTLVFPRVHILVFVVGALLSGAAIDYGFHLYLHAPEGPDEPYRLRLRRVMKPLLVSCLTTVIGFSILWFSDLPLLRHVGVFVSAGLISALAAAVLYFGQLPRHHLESRRGWPPLALPRHRMVRWALGLVLLALLAGGLARLRWHDDIRELEVPAPELTRIDQAVRARFGETAGRSVYLVTGDDVAMARERLAELQAQHPQHELASLGALLPTAAAYEALPHRLTELGGFPAALADALQRGGYDPAAFDPFFAEWAEAIQGPWPSYREIVDRLRSHLHGPLALMLEEGAAGAWLVVLSERPLTHQETPGLVEVNQLRTLNRLFARYRLNAVRLSLVGLAVVVGSVVLLYGPRASWRVVLIPLAATALAFAVLGWTHGPLNLFHLLGAFLGVCLSHDYAIFTVHQRAPGEPPPPSVRLAALTTAASFGVLGFSRIPVISALGATVALIVLCGLLAVEFLPGRRSTSAS